jgi:NAD(P)-dependent dehydrogenase (short-subunit alcohol dehydrogenase family)
MTSTKAIVTGAASGIGLGAARRLRDEGLDVIAVDLPGPRLDALAEEGFETLGADLSSPAGRDTVIAAGEGARALVNSAGIIRLKPILELTVDDLHDIYAVNVDAVWDLTSRVGRTMPSGGAIVNISSTSAKLSSTTEAAVYASSKAAVLSITRSFAYAFGPDNVRVNAICPGIIDTPMQDEVLAKAAAARGITAQELSDQRVASVPMRRGAVKEEIAGLIWYLISDDSSYMTGQAVNFDGGLVMH